MHGGDPGAAAYEPCRTLFAFAAITGARLSECLGLIWSELHLNSGAATATFRAQVDRAGRRQPLKTAEAERTVALPTSSPES